MQIHCFFAAAAASIAFGAVNLSFFFFSLSSAHLHATTEKNKNFFFVLIEHCSSLERRTILSSSFLPPPPRHWPTERWASFLASSMVRSSVCSSWMQILCLLKLRHCNVLHRRRQRTWYWNWFKQKVASVCPSLAISMVFFSSSVSLCVSHLLGLAPRACQVLISQPARQTDRRINEISDISFSTCIQISFWAQSQVMEWVVSFLRVGRISTS